MKITRPVSGKILTHAEGLGTPSPDTVRERARELALIDGRQEATEIDWKRAFIELHGGHHEGEGNGASEDEMLNSISERDMVAPTLGHRVNPIDIANEPSIGEELVAEGLDESAHDRMLEARRTIDRAEEED